MRILIDIGHPAHVHYFKNLIKIMEKDGHKFLIVARNKEIVHLLLDNLRFNYFNRGKGGSSPKDKFLYLFKGDFLLFVYAYKFKPDIFLSFASPYAAQVSWLFNKPHIVFDDTEHAKFSRKMYSPFSNVILTPKDFNIHLGKKQIRFDATMDIAYLHQNYFEPDYSILEENNIDSSEKIFFIRFVSWSASHDKGHSGFSNNGKRELINLLSKKGKIIISSESELPSELKKYSLNIPPEKVHSLMYYSDLFIGESGSMATEAAVVGTPSIIVNSSAHLFGVFNRIKNYNSLFIFSDENDALKKVDAILADNSSKKIAQDISKKIISDSINLTNFMVWFVENYPQSAKIMRENPDYQYRFK